MENSDFNKFIINDIQKFKSKLNQAIVKETKKPLPLEPMGAADRKIIHDAASNIDGISSSSDGEEPRRRVVLQPSA